MAKEKFTTLRSTAVPMPSENIDTDQIIPARFLKATTREGFGENLFRDWRFDPPSRDASAGKSNNEGTPNKAFVLNNPAYSGSILIAGKNFGCGSSREHAAWALHDYGFRVVISSFFADIFKNNALNNGLLPLVVSEAFLKKCLETVRLNPITKITVDLQEQKVTLEDGSYETFDINPYKKACLMNGQDDIDYLLGLRDEIRAFDKKQAAA